MLITELKNDIDYRPIDKKITLYHGSRHGLDGPIRHDYERARMTCDFGQGFYMGTDQDQALSLICTTRQPMLYETKLDLNGLRCVQVNGLAWAMLIAYHREKLTPDKNAKLFEIISGIAEKQDVVIGSIADDQMYRVLPEFFDDAITDQALLACLRRFDLGTQYVAKSQKACDHIKVLSERRLSERELKPIRESREKTRGEKDRITQETKARYRRQGMFFGEIVEQIERELQNEPDFFSITDV